MIVVSDTSPITSLLTIGLVEILERLYGHLLIPEAVCRELVVEHRSLPEFIRVQPIRERSHRDELQRVLDEGEAEAIVLAKELHADLLLIDEKKGRGIAESEGIPILGLMGVVVAAAKAGLLRSGTDVVVRLERQAGFRISDALREQIKKELGE